MSFTRNSESTNGLTLIEVLVFTGIFALVSVGIVGILVTTTRIQTRQSSSVVVNQESQRLLEVIQYYVENSSLIEMKADETTSTLKLRNVSSTDDPLYIFASGTTVYLKKTDSGRAEAITSENVKVTRLDFTKRENRGGHDSVAVVFNMEYNTSNPQQRFSRNFNFSIARVTAAVFDSNIVPSVTNTYKIGTVAQDWQSINNTIFFSGGNVGIINQTPSAVFDIQGVAGTNHILRVTSSSGSVFLAVASSGNIGIGTTNPDAKLDIKGVAGTDYILRVTSSSGSLFLAVASSGSVGVGGEPKASASFDVRGAAGKDYILRVVPSSGSEFLVVASSGNIGIGTTTPVSLLELYKTNTNPIFTITSANSTTYSPQIAFRTGATPATQYTIGTNIADNTLKLVKGSDITTSTGITIDTSGKVGIGTTTPSYLLSVAGTVYSASGGFRFPDGTTQTTAATGPKLIRQSSDQAVSGNSMTTSTELQFSVSANEVWVFTIGMFHTSSDSSNYDIKFDITAPPGSTCVYGGVGATNKAGEVSCAVTINDTNTRPGVNSNIAHGTVVVGSTGGSVALRFASQGTGGGGTITMKAGSYLIAYKIQ